MELMNQVTQIKVKPAAYAKIYPMVFIKDFSSLIETIRTQWTCGKIHWVSICKLIENSGFKYNVTAHYMVKGTIQEINNQTGLDLAGMSTKVFVKLNVTKIQLVNYKQNFFISTQGACEVVEIELSY